jgi:hypothetical protein
VKLPERTPAKRSESKLPKPFSSIGNDGDFRRSD